MLMRSPSEDRQVRCPLLTARPAGPVPRGWCALRRRSSRARRRRPARRRSASASRPAGSPRRRGRRAGEVGDVEAGHERVARSVRGRVRRPSAASDSSVRSSAEGGEDRKPEGAADLLRRVEEARREARVAVRRFRSSRSASRHERQAHPDRDRHEPGQQVGRGSCRPTSRRRKSSIPTVRDRHADDRGRADARSLSPASARGRRRCTIPSVNGTKRGRPRSASSRARAARRAS